MTGLMAQLQSLQQKAFEILNRAERSGDLRSALSAFRELSGTVKLTVRFPQARCLLPAVLHML